MKNQKLKPIVKWAGGKQGISSALVNLFPCEFSAFFEPFVGGGSVFLTKEHEKTVISDENKWLINTYKAFQLDWKKVCSILDGIENNKENFLRIRSVLPDELDIFDQAAHFVFLNKTCFRGLFRVNQKGQFNVPYGDYDRRYYDPENIEKVSEYLSKIEIRNGDFELGVTGITEDDFVYFDPPYYKLGGYSDFNRYTKLKFKESEHLRLAALCRELDERGIKWAVSNSNTPFVKFLYDGFNINEVSNRREINLASKNRNIKELFITNYVLPNSVLN